MIDGKLTALRYIEILQNNLFASVEKIELQNEYIFQQDNDSKHKAKLTMKFFENNNINVLEWLSQSPKLNPIKHLWDHLKRNITVNKTRNKTTFIKALYDK